MGRFLQLIVLFFGLGTACAQSWPEKPIRVIAPFAAGGPADVVARLIGPKTGEALGQPLVVENRTGAGGNVGAAAVAKSAPDGYTALLTTSAFAVNATLYAEPGYDAERDFAPTALLATQPNMIYVHPSVPAKTLAEFLAWAKDRKLAYASPGSGTTPHLTGENLLNVAAKLGMTPIHYRGAAPAIAAVLAGEPPVGSAALAVPLPHVKAGKLRALAVSSAQRHPALPEVPTLDELGYPGMQDYTWIALFLPAKTPAAIVEKMNEAANRALQSAEVRGRMDALALEPLGGTPQQAADYVRAEIVKWAKVVRDTGAKPD